MDFPNTRLEYDVTGGDPLFVSDTVIATNNILAAMAILLNIGNNFAIVSGLIWNSGTSTYSTGYISLNGIIYFANNGVALNHYLTPNILGVEPKLHGDSNMYPTYNINYASDTITSTAYTSPKFGNNNMDSYRIDMNTITTNLITAFANIALKANSSDMAIALALKLAIANNLSDLANIATARTNLSVYSKIEVDTELALKANKTAENWTACQTETGWTGIVSYRKDGFGNLCIFGSRTSGSGGSFGQVPFRITDVAYQSGETGFITIEKQHGEVYTIEWNGSVATFNANHPALDGRIYYFNYIIPLT